MRLGWKLPLERLSASSMGMAIQCPEQFRQKYLLKTSEQNFDSRFMGSVDHEMSRRMAQAKIDGVLERFHVKTAYQDAWDLILDQDGEPAWIKMEAPKAFDTGVKMSQLYLDEVVSKPDYVPAATEERISFRIPGVPCEVVGYVDTICATDNGGVIRERKTTAAKTTKPKPKWRFQALVYQYAVGLPSQWDIVTRQVTPQLYLASEWPDLYLGVQSPRFIRQMIYDTARRINDLYGQYGRDNPWPTTGIFGDWLCDYCAVGPKYNGTCPAWDTGRSTT